MLNFFYRLRKNLRDTRGVSLIVTMGLTILLAVIAATATKLVLGFMRTTFQVEQANVAYSAAEGGVELALYDLAAYKDGYETAKIDDADYRVCDEEINLTATTSFSNICNSSNKYRFVNFTTDSALSGGRGFWQLFSRTLASSGRYYLPNPYFSGDKDGNLETDEWGILMKNNPISWSLLIDNYPAGAEPKDRFLHLSDSIEKKIILLAGPGWDPNEGDSDQEDLLVWTFAALDGAGNEYTLQGVIWESDFTNQDCDGNGGVDADEFCFIFDLNDDGDHSPVLPDGDPYAGEDINRNLLSRSNSIGGNSFNRVAGAEETFLYSTPQKFLTDLNTAMGDVVSANQWVSARFTINLIATLSETSRDTSVSENDSLQFKLESDEKWADEYTFIISEGFAGDVKQSIETRFRRESAIPIFSYVIFQ